VNLIKQGIEIITLDDVKGLTTVEELFKYMLKHYETSILTRSKFRKLTSVLALSKTGLKKEELKECLEVKIEVIELYIKVFGFCLLEHK
jgi:hypothetical protein